MEKPTDQAGDLTTRVMQWIADGETYGVEFKGEQRERLATFVSSGIWDLAPI